MQTELKESFLALLNAFETLSNPTSSPKQTIKSASTVGSIFTSLSDGSSSSGNSILHVRNKDRKRKLSNHSIDGCKEKSRKTSVNSLIWKFKKSIKITENPLIEAVEEIEMEQIELKQLELNLISITEDIPCVYSQFYALVIDLIHKINHCGHETKKIKDWDHMESTIDQMIVFIRIIEDMKQSNSQFIIASDIFELTKTTKDFIHSKLSLYQDCLFEDCLRWRLLGFPVNDVEGIITQFNTNLFNIVESLIIKVLSINDLEVQWTTWEKPSTLISDTIEIISDSVKLMGNTQMNIKLSEYQQKLVVLYLQKNIKIIRDLIGVHNFCDSKLAYIYENLLRIFDYLTPVGKSRQSLFTDGSNLGEISIGSSMELDVSERDTALFHVIIEIGLELCSYCSRKRPNEGSQMKAVIYEICKKYVAKTAMLIKTLVN
jgi:hypothetical protein